MKSDACAGQLSCARSQAYETSPLSLTIRVFSREPNPLVMTATLGGKKKKRNLNN